MYAVAIIKPVRAVMTFATSTVTLIAIRAFMVFSVWVQSRSAARLRLTVAVLWWLRRAPAGLLGGDSFPPNERVCPHAGDYYGVAETSPSSQY